MENKKEHVSTENQYVNLNNVHVGDIIRDQSIREINVKKNQTKLADGELVTKVIDVMEDIFYEGDALLQVEVITNTVRPSGNGYELPPNVCMFTSHHEKLYLGILGYASSLEEYHEFYKQEVALSKIN